MAEFRGFIAIDIASFQKLSDFINEIKNSSANIKTVEPENIHITLKFLGDTNEEKIDTINEIIINSVKEIKPFDIKLKSTGFFPNQNYIKVVWVGIQNTEQIQIIAEKIDKKLAEIGFNREKRKFSAHLTIARVRSAKNKEKLIQIINKYKDVEFATIAVDKIKLKKSVLTQKGPIYSTLKEVAIE